MRASLLLAALLALIPASPMATAQERATLTVAPPSGPTGTTFQLRAAGLPPGIAVLAIMRLPDGEELATPSPGQVSPIGEWVPPSWRSREGDPVGRYTVLIATADGATVLASGSFTITGPPTAPVQLPGTRI
jgi:hypothetical protein